jgi:hypothetical protein
VQQQGALRHTHFPLWQQLSLQCGHGGIFLGCDAETEAACASVACVARHCFLLRPVGAGGAFKKCFGIQVAISMISEVKRPLRNRRLDVKRLQIYNGYVQRPSPNGQKYPFGCNGNATAVAAGQRQRFYSGVGTCVTGIISLPPQVLRFPPPPLESRGLISISTANRPRRGRSCFFAGVGLSHSHLRGWPGTPGPRGISYFDGKVHQKNFY